MFAFRIITACLVVGASILVALLVLVGLQIANGKMYDIDRETKCNLPHRQSDGSCLKELHLVEGGRSSHSIPDIPAHIREEILSASLDPRNGKRVELGKLRQGRTLTTQTVEKLCPLLMREYLPSLERHVSKRIVEGLKVSDRSLPTSVSVIVYEREGDGIDWHYDSNHFRGKFFTMIIPVRVPGDKREKCAHFRYMHNGVVHKLRGTSDQDTPVIFEGERLYHGSTRACAHDPPRVILSIQFTDDDTLTPLSRFHTWMKDRTFEGTWPKKTM